MYTSYQEQYRPIPSCIEPDVKSIIPDIELLKELYLIQTPTLDKYKQDYFLEFIVRYLKEKGIKFTQKKDAYGNLYLTKGKSKYYPTIVSHVDTVHPYNGNLEILETSTAVFGFDTRLGKQHGIGADPKNGVLFCIQMMLKLPHVKVVLFLNEESGCLGSKEADIDFFKDSAFVCQLDRRSFTNDIIINTNGIDVCSKEFIDANRSILKKYAYSTNTGTCTDVGELVWNGVGVSCFNFSNGSMNEHRAHEICSKPHLTIAFNCAYEIIINSLHKRWEFKPDLDYKFGSYTYGYDDWSGFKTTTKVKGRVVSNEEDFLTQYIFPTNGIRTFSEKMLNYIHFPMRSSDIADDVLSYLISIESKVSPTTFCQNVLDFICRHNMYMKNKKDLSALRHEIKEAKKELEDLAFQL